MATPAPVTSLLRPLPFSDQAVRDAISRAIENDPDAKHWAFVAHADVPGMPTSGANIAIMVKLDDGWSFGGYVDKRYNGPLSGGAEVRFSR